MSWAEQKEMIRARRLAPAKTVLEQRVDESMQEARRARARARRDMLAISKRLTVLLIDVKSGRHPDDIANRVEDIIFEAKQRRRDAFTEASHA